MCIFLEYTMACVLKPLYYTQYLWKCPSNLSIAGARGILRDHLGQWISSFSLHVDLATNNMAELVAVRQGLAMAWTMVVKIAIWIVGSHDFTIPPHQNNQNRTRIVKMVGSYVGLCKIVQDRMRFYRSYKKHNFFFFGIIFFFFLF